MTCSISISGNTASLTFDTSYTIFDNLQIRLFAFLNAYNTKMEILLNLTLDEICEQRKDRFSLNLRKRRLLKSKRKMFRYKCLSLKRKIPKNKSFIKTIKSFPEDIFYSHFRMNWATFKVRFYKFYEN